MDAQARITKQRSGIINRARDLGISPDDARCPIAQMERWTVHGIAAGTPEGCAPLIHFIAAIPKLLSFSLFQTCDIAIVGLRSVTPAPRGFHCDHD